MMRPKGFDQNCGRGSGPARGPQACEPLTQPYPKPFTLQSVLPITLSRQVTRPICTLTHLPRGGAPPTRRATRAPPALAASRRRVR
eukprot:352249-Chlamydomonas_euryale.AAC.15